MFRTFYLIDDSFAFVFSHCFSEINSVRFLEPDRLVQDADDIGIRLKEPNNRMNPFRDVEFVPDSVCGVFNFLAVYLSIKNDRVIRFLSFGGGRVDFEISDSSFQRNRFMPNSEPIRFKFLVGWVNW